MKNEILKKLKNETKIIDILKIIGCAIASVVLSIIVVNNIKHLSYKEAEATLISHGEIIQHTESSDSCIGTFEYYVNDVKYEASFSINYQYCFKGYKTKIYYDSNNPEVYSDNKSIFMLILFLIFDGLFIFGLIESIKELFKHSREIDDYATNPRNSIEPDDSKYEDARTIELDSAIYGKYKLNYDPNSNDNSGKNEKHIELSVIKSSEHSLNIFEIYAPKDILNKIFETNKMNDVLESLNKIELNNEKRIIEKLVNQEIKTLSTWCEVPESSEGKRILIDNGSLISYEIEIDKSFNLAKIYWNYYYDASSVTLSFSYDIKTEKIQVLDVWC